MLGCVGSRCRGQEATLQTPWVGAEAPWGAPTVLTARGTIEFHFSFDRLLAAEELLLSAVEIPEHSEKDAQRMENKNSTQNRRLRMKDKMREFDVFFYKIILTVKRETILQFHGKYYSRKTQPQSIELFHEKHQLIMCGQQQNSKVVRNSNKNVFFCFNENQF